MLFSIVQGVGLLFSTQWCGSNLTTIWTGLKFQENLCIDHWVQFHSKVMEVANHRISCFAMDSLY